MRSLNITSIQRGCLYDGPGVRTTVFLRGCILKCPWCCNPETIFLENDFFLDNSKCLKIKHINSSLCDNCERYGGAISVDNCPFGVSERISDIYPFEDLINELLKDKTLFDATGGGITFSGGEPLLQVADLTDLCY